MTVSEHWNQVENARCRLEQLSSLMSVYGTDFLDLPKEELCGTPPSTMKT